MTNEKMTKAEIQTLAIRINEGIRLTRIRLLEKAKAEGRNLIIAREGKVISINAREL